MLNLTDYNQNLKKTITDLESEDLSALINLDSIDSVLRRVLTKEEMKEAGCFFTGQKLSDFLVDSLKQEISKESIILDPTCGAGNLLIACSRKLPVYNSLSTTLKLWGHALRGFDTQQSFIDSAKLRLIIEAINRGAKKDCSIEVALQYFSKLLVRNVMSLSAHEIKDVTHAVINPPFVSWDSPNNYYWKKGKINSAGIVFDHLIRMLPCSCAIGAILPEVLRAGSRYHDFRKFISTHFLGTVEVWGKFSSVVDVDVFTLIGEKHLSKHTLNWQPFIDSKPSIIDDYFHVRTGPLVAYRSPKKGKVYPYIYPRNCPAWEVINEAVEHRPFEGSVLNPPFVVIRRTSSPSDAFRAVATVVNIPSLVAVENHLLVLTPKSGKLEDCLRLMEILKDDKTNTFLNNRVRLRHLTVSSVKEIPVTEEHFLL